MIFAIGWVRVAVLEWKQNLVFVMWLNACFYNGYKHVSSNSDYVGTLHTHTLFMLCFHIEAKTESTCCHLWCLLCSVFTDFLHLSSTHSYVPFLKLCSIIAFGWLSVMTFCSTEHKSEREADDSCLCSFLYPALMCPVCWSPKPVVGRALLSPAASL